MLLLRPLVLASLAAVAACTSTAPPVEVRPRAPSSHAMPAPPAEPSRTGCTDVSLSEGTRPIRPTEQQIALFADADRLLAKSSAPSDAAGRAFAQARALWGARRWPEATRAFGEIALAYPREDAGMLAAMLYLEGLNLLGSRIEPPRPACYEELAGRLPTLTRLYCERGENRRHPQECRLFFRIERDLARTGCVLPTGPAEPAPVLYARAGERYLATAARCVETARLAGVSPLEDRCDDLAFYAVRAFLGVPDETRAGEARRLLLDPANGMLTSPRVPEMQALTPRDP